MRILILGGTGMLGHTLWRQWRDRHDVWVSSRSSFNQWERFSLFDAARFIGGLDVLHDHALAAAIDQVRPDAVVNCVGVIKQRPEAHDPLISLQINSVLPHRLARLGATGGWRLVHVSTDCVFNGQRGDYTESDVSDAEDLYGRTKFLGEVNGHPGTLTLRTSIIGRELTSAAGLVEWFLSQHGSVRGFSRAIYTGITAAELGRVIMRILEERPALAGLWQVSAEKITKFDLLVALRDAFHHDVAITADSAVAIDRSLISARFRSVFAYAPPDWATMISELAADRSTYAKWRTTRVA